MTDFEFLIYLWIAGLLTGITILGASIALSVIRR